MNRKKLTLIGNSDIHPPILMDFDLSHGGHRPMTLVFSDKKTEAAIKEALFARRTAVYFGESLMGEEKFLKPIFEQSINLLNQNISLKGTSSTYIQIHNQLDLIFELVSTKEMEEISIPGEIKFYPCKTVIFQINGKLKDQSGKKKFSIPFIVKNLLIAPEQGLSINLNFEVNFIAE